MEFLIAATAFALGAIVGSFLNVVIHRYPREESIVFPASHCASCQTAIKPYDNVPILSYLWLRGRCRHCREPFSIRYPLVELANALFYLAIFQRTGPSVFFLPIAAIVSMLIVLIYIDAEIQILPDVITYPAIALGLGTASLGAAASAPELFLATGWRHSLIGALSGAWLLTMLILVYWLIRRIEGMGWGDVKMLAMIGALMGLEGVPAVLLLASVAGAAIGIPLALRHEKGMQVALPFGVFLGIATLGVLFFGHTLFSLWVRLVLLR
ncbi:MAG TPA: prepilin peptidase [Thermoanaerobaculia bacterium]|nr:prepilin peptidase [Thermoanaerobaculia bacterium]